MDIEKLKNSLEKKEKNRNVSIFIKCIFLLSISNASTFFFFGSERECKNKIESSKVPNGYSRIKIKLNNIAAENELSNKVDLFSHSGKLLSRQAWIRQELKKTNSAYSDESVEEYIIDVKNINLKTLINQKSTIMALPHTGERIEGKRVNYEIVF